MPCALKENSLSTSSSQARLLWIAVVRGLASWEIFSTWIPKDSSTESLLLQARQVSWYLVLWDGSVAVPMVDLDVALTVEIGLEDIVVAMVPPPGAELPVPGAVQHMEELRVLHADHGEEVLVPEVTVETVLVCKLLHLSRL